MVGKTDFSSGDNVFEFKYQVSVICVAAIDKKKSMVLRIMIF